jgi:hypothetical protein
MSSGGASSARDTSTAQHPARDGTRIALDTCFGLELPSRLVAPPPINWGPINRAKWQASDEVIWQAA